MSDQLDDDLINVYCAGKIYKSGWRHDLFGGLRNAYDAYEDKIHYFPTYEDSIRYVGPFFSSCDHGCAHGSATHGRPIADTGGTLCASRCEERESVFKRCVTRLEQSDKVFCWLNSKDAYGTLTELGIAYEKNKDIHLFLPKTIDAEWLQEIWFPCQTTWHVNHSEDHKKAWTHFVGEVL